jgi:hypothetical protein
VSALTLQDIATDVTQKNVNGLKCLKAGPNDGIL